jgi:ABC-type sugar transport system substrate-binding protein
MKTRFTLVAGLLAVAGMALLGGCEQKQPASSTPAPAPATKAVATPAPKSDAKSEAKPDAKAETPKADAKKSYTIGIIAKSQSNPVFQAAKTGALDACEALSKKYGVEIKGIWQTPVSEDAQKQAQFIEQLTSQGVDGISISCTDGNVLQKPIDDAVGKGVTVVTFD